MVVKGVVTEIDVLVVEIGGKVTAEEVTVNELDLDKDTESELAFDVEPIKIDMDEVDTLVAEDEVVDKAYRVDANHEGVTVDEAVTLVGAVTVLGAVAVGEAVTVVGAVAVGEAVAGII